MNTQAVGMEICNNGLGEPYSSQQIEACLSASMAICNGLGIPIDDVCTHQVWAPTRKIDPAQAGSVQGNWQPQSTTSSGTWSLSDLQAELRKRGQTSIPPSIDYEDDEMATAFVRHGTPDGVYWNSYVVVPTGKWWVHTNEAIAKVQENFGYAPIPVDDVYMDATGPVIGPNPETADAWGKWTG
jgi:hypothetical protein